MPFVSYNLFPAKSHFDDLFVIPIFKIENTLIDVDKRVLTAVKKKFKWNCDFIGTASNVKF